MWDWFYSLGTAERITIIIFGLGIPLSIIGYFLNRFISNFFDRRKKLKAYYELIWKKSSRLKPSDIMKERGEPKYGFNKYYYEREINKKVIDGINNDKHILVIGNPIAGKTRAVFFSLKKLEKIVNIIVPRVVDINTEEFFIPRNFSFWRKKILFLDDIDKYTEKTNFLHLLSEFLKENVLIIATCRTGKELAKLQTMLETKFSSIFTNTLEIIPIPDKEAIEIVKKGNVKLSENFDGNIGSLYLELDAMTERFKKLDNIPRGILRTIKRLYFGGVFDERENFNIGYIKEVCKEIEDIDLKGYEWKEKLTLLESQKFIKIIDENYLWAEEVYLQKIIEDNFRDYDNIQILGKIFNDIAEALQYLASSAYEKGIISLEKQKYIQLSIVFNNNILQTYTLERFPIDYAMTQNNLGTAYRTLAEVDDKSEYCRKAISAYDEALKIFTNEEYPQNYEMLINNLRITKEFCSGH